MFLKYRSPWAVRWLPLYGTICSFSVDQPNWPNERQIMCWIEPVIRSESNLNMATFTHLSCCNNASWKFASTRSKHVFSLLFSPTRFSLCSLSLCLVSQFVVFLSSDPAILYLSLFFLSYIEHFPIFECTYCCQWKMKWLLKSIWWNKMSCSFLNVCAFMQLMNILLKNLYHSETSWSTIK